MKYYKGKYKGIEAMDVVLDFSEDNYNIGTALTYLMRAGKKPGNPMTQDLHKAIVHLQREIQHQNERIRKDGTPGTTPDPGRNDARQQGEQYSGTTTRTTLHGDQLLYNIDRENRDQDPPSTD